MLPSTAHWTLEDLQARFEPLSPTERLQQLYTYFNKESVLLTSSFGTQSALLLYWISNLQPDQVVDLHPAQVAHQQTRAQELWQHQPSRCCFINKVQPLEQVKLGYDIWISGLRRYQTPQRKDLTVFEQQDNIIKFYPLLDWSAEQFEAAYTEADLPRHPLQALGYHSIGCWHCTQRGTGRSGRWAGSNKTECGLHFKT